VPNRNAGSGSATGAKRRKLHDLARPDFFRGLREAPVMDSRLRPEHKRENPVDFAHLFVGVSDLGFTAK
jgi:hypothetical protein